MNPLGFFQADCTKSYVHININGNIISKTYKKYSTILGMALILYIKTFKNDLVGSGFIFQLVNHDDFLYLIIRILIIVANMIQTTVSV